MSTTEVIRRKSELTALAKALSGEKVVLCQGHFNVIHPGHRRFLEHARSLGTKLVTAVFSNRFLAEKHPDQRFFPQEERAANVASHTSVSHVVILDEQDILSVVRSLRPATLILGTEFEEERAAEVEDLTTLVRELGGQVVFHSGAVNYSDDDLLGRNPTAREQERRVAFRQACQRQGIDLRQLADEAQHLTGSRLLVVGDTIVDQYIACDALGMSAEAPVVALRELRTQEFIGGAAIVAAHIRSLGAQCTFLSVTGDDAAALKVKMELATAGVDAQLLLDPARPTTFKIRYMVGNQKLLRVSRLEQSTVPREIERELVNRINELAPKVDGIVVSDFVYGVVTPRVVEAVVSAARRCRIPIFGDVQCSSQVGSCLKFKHFSLISPNEREARIALGDNDSGLEKIAMKLLSKTDCAGLLLTLGPNGCVAYDNTGANPSSESFPALDPNPVDVAGAGDAMLSAVAVATAARWPLMKAAALGSCVAALQVSRIGNTPISADEVREYMARELLGDMVDASAETSLHG